MAVTNTTGSKTALKEKYKKFLTATKENLLSENPIAMRVLVCQHKLSDSAREALHKTNMIYGTPRHYQWSAGEITDELIEFFYHEVASISKLHQIRTLRNKLEKANTKIIMLEIEIRKFKQNKKAKK